MQADLSRFFTKDTPPAAMRGHLVLLAIFALVTWVLLALNWVLPAIAFTWSALGMELFIWKRKDIRLRGQHWYFWVLVGVGMMVLSIRLFASLA